MKEDVKPISRVLLSTAIICVAVLAIIYAYALFKPAPESLSGIEENTRITGSILKEMVNNSVKVIVKEDGRSFQLTSKDDVYFSEAKKYKVINIVYNTDNRLLECYLEYNSKPESIIDREPVKKWFK